jgi:hypothetical protein
MSLTCPDFPFSSRYVFTSASLRWNRNAWIYVKSDFHLSSKCNISSSIFSLLLFILLIREDICDPVG